MFEHEKLRVFHATQLLLKELRALKQKIAPGFAGLMAVILEAAESIAFNIAEGCGDGRPGKKVNYFRIASGSAGECAGGLTCLVSEGGVAKKHTYKSADLLVCIVRMLNGLADYFDGLSE